MLLYRDNLSRLFPCCTDYRKIGGVEGPAIVDGPLVYHLTFLFTSVPFIVFFRNLSGVVETFLIGYLNFFFHILAYVSIGPFYSSLFLPYDEIIRITSGFL